ncbi:MAG TPA: Gfo/Idh/MocA family oxidoreductase [Candidatus Saccharimonadales bacterium]|nr:Gfo/Idh/MocA family oxidoreductase [Candidatus Saccharimonadales bacterium]
MTNAVLDTSTTELTCRAKPRLGFLGLGWIGRNRMESIVQSGLAEVVGIAEPAASLMAEAAKVSPTATHCSSLEELLELPLDGVVIATPSALHAKQSIVALEAGMHVFCQKPLGRDALETARVVDAARANNKLLGVDLSYRFMDEVRAVTDLVKGGDLGHVYAIDLTFHNAYGPNKSWFYDPKLSGGGCVIDLGIHLVDLGLWALGFPVVDAVTSRLFAQGRPLVSLGAHVEDHAVARVDLRGGTVLQVSCSWKLHAGCDAVISGAFYGTRGSAQFRNVNGSFFDFVGERMEGTKRVELSSCRGGWGGRAALEWVRRVHNQEAYDPANEHLVEVAKVLDAIYQRGLKS